MTIQTEILASIKFGALPMPIKLDSFALFLATWEVFLKKMIQTSKVK